MLGDGRIFLPKSWGRARRKAHRAWLNWMRWVLVPAHKRMLDSIWGDAMDGIGWTAFAANTGQQLGTVTGMEFVDG